MRRLARVLAILALLALWSCALPPTTAGAQETSGFEWDRYDVEIVLQPDGTFDVAETQVLDIRRTLRKGYREIPLERVGGIGGISVEEPGRRYVRGSGEPYTYSATRDQQTARIDWWFPPTSGGTRTFILRYRVSETIRVYEDGDQLVWTAIYADRPAPIRASTITLRFPGDVPAQQVRLAAYPEGSVAQPRLIDGRTAVFDAADIPPGRPLEVRAQFPHGLVQASPPSWQREADLADWFEQNARPVLNFLLLLATLAIGVLGSLALGGLWYARGRDPAVGAVPTSLSEPPSDLPAGVVGTLVDERADVQDVIATLVDLANRGVIRITAEHNPELLGSPLDYRLERQADPVGLRAYEKTVLATLFRGGDAEVRVSDLKERFNRSIPLFQDQLHAEVVRAGFFHADPEQARRRYRALGTALLVVGILGGAFALLVVTQWVELAALPFVALAILGGVARRLANAMPRRTQLGALEAARWRAFGTFLREEHDHRRLEIERDKLEPWLPYAVALGVDQSWVRNLQSVGTPRPSWYVSTGYPGPYRSGYGGVGGPPIIITTPPWGQGTGTPSDGTPRGDSGSTGVAVPTDPGSPGGLEDWSGSLGDLLNRTSDVLGHGGGSGWSGGGWGGGGGGSGGGSGGFE